MRKTAWIVASAVVIPSLVLGALVLRKAGDQQIILERQTALLYQQSTDAVAALVRELVETERQAFVEHVNALLLKRDGNSVARDFSATLRREWPRARVGFAVRVDGSVVAPSAAEAVAYPAWRDFLAENSSFLSNQGISEIYQSLPALPARAEASVRPSKVVQRNVMPQQKFTMKGFESQESKLMQRSSDFASATSVSTSGTLARFVQNRLEILFWLRPAASAHLVFGAMLQPEDLKAALAEKLASFEVDREHVVLAILDERAEPVYRSLDRFETNWKLPFAATEIGEVMPHWEAAIYLIDANRFTEDARWVSNSLVILVALSLVAIVWGSYAVVSDTKRQMDLVEKKADFVSNVSHELKSPLTSIRLFAEMLEQNRVNEPEKRQHFLRVISLEAERLSRLISNVLDFSRLEKGVSPKPSAVVDAYPIIERTWQAAEAHLASRGFRTEWQRVAAPPYLVTGDPDGIAQVLVNLFSNSEKYSGDRKEVTLRTLFEDSQLVLSVLDRGFGVPKGHEALIFEPFHRAHDGLASGISGTGLGLALAQKLAAENGGVVLYRAREGGGSEFILRLPRISEAGS